MLAVISGEELSACLHIAPLKMPAHSILPRSSHHCGLPKWQLFCQVHPYRPCKPERARGLRLCLIGLTMQSLARMLSRASSAEDDLAYLTKTMPFAAIRSILQYSRSLNFDISPCIASHDCHGGCRLVHSPATHAQHNDAMVLHEGPLLSTATGSEVQVPVLESTHLN